MHFADLAKKKKRDGAVKAGEGWDNLLQSSWISGQRSYQGGTGRNSPLLFCSPQDKFLFLFYSKIEDGKFPFFRRYRPS